MSNYPKIVALNTDWTMWQNYLDSTKWGRRQGAVFATQEDSIMRVNEVQLRDSSNATNWIRLFNDVPRIINDVLRNGAQLAIVSANPSRAMTDRANYYFNAIKPSDNQKWSIVHLVTYDEVKNELKTFHFRRIEGYSKKDYLEMLFYDDEALNNRVRIELGVTFEFCRNKGGLNWTNYQEGLTLWRNMKRNTLLTQPSSQRKRVRIGFSGLSPLWENLVRKGEGIVDPKTPYRWGYALYVADDIGVAKFFCDWDREDWGNDSHVYEVFVEDYDAWTKINKVFIREREGYFGQMGNMEISYEEAGVNQENRDRDLLQKYGITAPYVLYCRHHHMDGMPVPANQRINEMIIYTQIVKSLITLRILTDDQVASYPNRKPYPIEDQFRTWNIKVLPETVAEFRKNNENDFVAKANAAGFY